MHAERHGQTALVLAGWCWLGDVDDVATVLHAADAVLITSDIEGMPGTAIEAAMCGVPVVATDVGALSSMPGVHVTSGDPPSLAEALEATASARSRSSPSRSDDRALRLEARRRPVGAPAW